MTINELVEKIKEGNIDITENLYEGETENDYAVYYITEQNPFFADGEIYYSDIEMVIELYKKNQSSQTFAQLKDILAVNGITYNLTFASNEITKEDVIVFKIGGLQLDE